MRNNRIQWFVLGVGLWVAPCIAQESDTKAGADGPYGVIYERNPFDLKPPAPPAPPPPVEEPPPPPSNISLTGISSLSAKKKVFLIVTNPADNSQDYVTLTEGQRKKGIEVLSIQPEDGLVKIKNGGKEETLSFETHGRKSSTPARPVRTAAGAMPGKGGVASRAPTSPVRQPVNGMVTLNFRNGSGGNAPQLMGGQPGVASTASGSSGISVPTRVAIPTREVRTSNYSSPRTRLDLSESEKMIQSPEESVIIMEAIREENASQINQGTFPPLPDILGGR